MERRFELNKYGKIYPISLEVNSYMDGNPVSYTHLDVYKRQVLGFLKEEPDSQRIAEAGIYVGDGEEIMPDIWYGIKGRQEAA